MENLKKSGTIKSWASDDQPREKLLSKGPEALSNSELLAILILNGHKEKTAVDLARDILSLGNNNLNELGKLPVTAFQKIKGIGEAKAITIAAALELGRRRHAGDPLDKKVVTHSAQVAEYIKTMIKDYNHEVFAVIFLNKSNKVNHFEVISKGGISATIADPRIILKIALNVNATSLILCHNHPSGSLKPSRADEEITVKIGAAARLLDMTVTDHIIVSENGYFSFADEGLL